MKLKPYHTTLDKIDDKRMIYMRTLNDKYDFSNMSITITLNNPREHIDESTKALLCKHVEKIRQNIQFESDISPEYEKALNSIKSQRHKKTGARYDDEFTSRIAFKIQGLVNSLKKNQNKRRTINGRESMHEFTDEDSERIKVWMIDNFLYNRGRCEISRIPICFAGLNGKAKVSVDRINNSIGYEDTQNIQLVAVFFQSEFNHTKTLDHFKWTPDLFKKYGDLVFGNKLQVRYADLDEDVRHELEHIGNHRASTF
jgi:hypothetical protein